MKKEKKTGKKAIKNPAKRSKATIRELRTHSDKLSARADGSAMGHSLMKESASEMPNRADLAMRRMVQGDVFRSAKNTIKSTNSNSRRYK